MLTLAMEIDGNFIPVLAIGGSFVIVIVSIVGGIIRSVLATRTREQSRREIAAYVAEGSMSAEEGERLMKAGRSSADAKDRGCC